LIPKVILFVSTLFSDLIFLIVKVMQTLVHPNIVRLIDIHKTDRHVYLIMEYCDQNDLAHLIHKMGPMVRDVARPLLKQLCTLKHP